MYLRFVSGIILRRYNSNFNCEIIRNVQFYPQNHGKVHSKFKWCKWCKITLWLEEQSIQVKRACTRQCEFIVEQKIRRSLQLFHLYTKIWDEVALKEFIRLYKCRITNNTKNFLIGTVGITMYDWEQERISDKEIYSYVNEIEETRRLRDLTLVCPECHLRIVIDVNQPGVKYCQYHKENHASNILQQEVEWKPFTECKDMLVWRKEEQSSRGLYSYKIYGSFDDVSAEDFLQVQIDLDYRTKWDTTVKQLKIIDTDPLSKLSIENCNDIIYWETIWPKMFANRDYVYQRKWLYNKETGIIIIVNKGTNHPNAPNRSDTYRVTKYWSCMVIKPFTNVHEPGVEFGMTYFDNPGMNVPGVTTWIIMSGLTNYLCQLREAVKNYKNYKALQASEHTISHSNTTNSLINKTDVLDIKTEEDNNNEKVEEIIPNNNEVIKNVKHEQSEPVLTIGQLKNENENENKEENSEFDSINDEDRGLFDNFLLTKLFV